VQVIGAKPATASASAPPAKKAESRQ